MVRGARLAGRLVILPLAPVSLPVNTARGFETITCLREAFSKLVRAPEGQGVMMLEPMVTMVCAYRKIDRELTYQHNSPHFGGRVLPLFQMGTTEAGTWLDFRF